MANEETKQEPVIHTESVDSGAVKCPRCGSTQVKWVFTKESVAIKCSVCNFDTHYLHDILSHRGKELEALPLLKNIAPVLNFVENTEYSWDWAFEPRPDQEHLIYDCKVFFFGMKLERLKVSVLQNIQLSRYLETDTQYLQGRQEVFKKLADMGALLVFYLPDDAAHKIAIADCRELMHYAKEVKDKFGNTQFSIPKEVRGSLIESDEEKIRQILFRNLVPKLLEKRYVL